MIRCKSCARPRRQFWKKWLAWCSSTGPRMGRRTWALRRGSARNGGLPARARGFRAYLRLDDSDLEPGILPRIWTRFGPISLAFNPSRWCARLTGGGADLASPRADMYGWPCRLVIRWLDPARDCTTWCTGPSSRRCVGAGNRGQPPRRIRPNGRSRPKKTAFMPFTDPDPEDIVTKGVKIVGKSAQRRRQARVLQHGVRCCCLGRLARPSFSVCATSQANPRGIVIGQTGSREAASSTPWDWNRGRGDISSRSHSTCCKNCGKMSRRVTAILIGSARR